MAEEIKVILEADADGLVAGFKRANLTLAESETFLARFIAKGASFGKALDELGKKGGLSLNFLEKQIKDFGDAIQASTDPNKTKALTKALEVLTAKERSLLEATNALSKGHSGHTVATQRLSASVLGLSKTFDILPPELQHITHGFEQLFQGIERASEGGDHAGSSFKKVAGVIAQVGLGLVASAGIGALVSQIVELAEEAKKLSFGARDIREFNNSFAEGASKSIASLELLKAKINDSNTTQAQRVELVKAYNKEADAGNKIDLTQINNLDFINQRILEQIELLKKRAAVRAAEGIIAQKFEGLFKLQLELDTSFPDLDKARNSILSRATAFVNEANKALKITPSFDIKELVALSDLPAKQLKELADKGGKFELFKDPNAVATLKRFNDQLKNTTSLTKNLGQAGILEGLQRQIGEAQEGVDQALNTFGKILDFEGFTSQDSGKKLQSLLDDRLAIIEEFTKKFASIKLPLPIFDKQLDNIAVSKVNNKLLREFLQGTFNVFEKNFKEIFDPKNIDPLTLPIDIHPKAEITGKSEIVRLIEDKLGEIGKDVENAVNKAIFEVPVDFKIAPEGDGQALKQFEVFRDNFLNAIESLTGQRRAILDISPDFLASLDPAKARSVIEKLQDQIQAAASGVPLKVVMKGTADVQLVVDKDKIAIDLAHDINDAIQSGLKDIFTGLGDLIGDAISKGFDSDGAKEVLSAISGIIGNVGKALVKAGVALLGLQKVIDKLATNPALAIALGITLVALSRAFQNSISGAREKGGPVQAGISYLVNEKGREIFQPNSGSPYWIEGGAQLFKPKTSGKIIPVPLTASFAKMFADRFQRPKFADGGLVSGPVFGLLGEGSSISSINPEVIAPLETLKNLLPGFKGQSVDVRVTGSLSNRTIKLGQAREGRSNRRNS